MRLDRTPGKACQNVFEEKPLRDKQKKLQDSIDETLEFYSTNNPEKVAEYKSWKVVLGGLP